MPLSYKTIFFENYLFYISEQVYEPAEDSFLFAENLAVRKGDYVLDTGTGCGILGIVAAATASRIIAIDINPHAIYCAKQNAKQNHVEGKCFPIRGNLLTPIRMQEKFDLILFNAPYLPVEHEDDNSWLKYAWTGGSTGREIIDRFIAEATKHMKPDGRILLMQSTLAGIDETLKNFARRNLKTRILAERSLPFFESIMLIEAR